MCDLTETSDTDITTTEIIKRRDVGPYGIRSEYCIRKIICPLGVPETPKGNDDSKSAYVRQLLCFQMCFFLSLVCLSFLWAETPTPQRKGLRSSALRPKKPEPAKQTGPVVIETWVAEEDLELWEIRAFTERWEFPLFFLLCVIFYGHLHTLQLVYCTNGQCVHVYHYLFNHTLKIFKIFELSDFKGLKGKRHKRLTQLRLVCRRKQRKSRPNWKLS